jgi:hypothetical protein
MAAYGHLIRMLMITVFSSLLGFIFALCLFYITQNEKEKLERRSLANLLKSELEYNINLIDEWIKEIKQNLYFTKWAKPVYIFSARYDLFQNNFIDKAFKSGIIYYLFDNNHVKDIAKILAFYTIDRKRSILDRINKNKEIDIVYTDDEGVPTTGKDYIQDILESETSINKDMQNSIIEIISLIKYEENVLSNVMTKVINFVQTRLKRFGL